MQISDTHFSADRGVPPQWPAVLDWLAAEPPDLLVHTGDIVYEDPDDDVDRAFAKSLLDQAPVPYVVIPGNHDIGFFGDEADLPRRLDAFRGDVGRATASSVISPAGASSAPTRTCSARLTTTPGCATR